MLAAKQQPVGYQHLLKSVCFQELHLHITLSILPRWYTRQLMVLASLSQECQVGNSESFFMFTSDVP